MSAEKKSKTIQNTKNSFFRSEYLTSLRGGQLVQKSSPIIIWRGKMDSLIARIIETQLLSLDFGNKELVKELEEILEFVSHLLACEVKENAVEINSLLGMTLDEIKFKSHEIIQKNCGQCLVMSYKMGKISVGLNNCRVLTRETELAAIIAFSKESNSNKHADIIISLNRLSSLFYVLSYKYLLPDFFNKDGCENS